MLKKVIGLICWCLVALATQGQPLTTLVYNGTKMLPLGRYFQIYEDTTQMLEIEQLRQLPPTVFQKTEKNAPNFEVRKSKIWLKLTLQNQNQEPLFLLCDEENIFKLELYVIDAKDSVMYYKTGFLENYNSRFFQNNQLTLPLGTHPQTLYIGISGDATLLASMYVASEKALASWQHWNDTFEGVFLGWMLLVLLYNLFIFVQLRERLYLTYCVYVITCSFVVIRLEGIGFDLLWPEYPSFNRWIDTPSVINTWLVILFAMQFLQTKAIVPRLHRILQVYLGIVCCLPLLEFFNIRPLSNNLTMLSFLISCALLMTTAITVFWKGLQQARFYLLGWTVFLGSVVVITLWKMGIITSTHFLVYNAFPIGTMLEAALFSFALADRFRIFRQEADDARSLSLKRLEENEKLLTEYQRVQEQNRQLQQKNSHVILKDAPQPLKRLSVPSMNGMLLLPLSDIIHLQAMGSYCTIFLTNQKKVMASKPLADFEPFLVENEFMRVHKSHLINLRQVVRYVKGDGGTLVMTDESEVSVSRTKKAELLAILGI
ncbi:MAG TPA: hypothetical protein DCM71_17265 [Runella sp.]|nr:hypothetical protein [Runella sp.]